MPQEVSQIYGENPYKSPHKGKVSEPQAITVRTSQSEQKPMRRLSLLWVLEGERKEEIFERLRRSVYLKTIKNLSLPTLQEEHSCLFDERGKLWPTMWFYRQVGLKIRPLLVRRLFKLVGLNLSPRSKELPR